MFQILPNATRMVITILLLVGSMHAVAQETEPDPVIMLQRKLIMDLKTESQGISDDCGLIKRTMESTSQISTLER